MLGRVDVDAALLHVRVRLAHDEPARLFKKSGNRLVSFGV
jgi:hypothetical protein